MKRKNTYKELHIDDLMLLIPDDLYTSDWKHSHTKILWSHKKVEYKIFGKMDANIVIDIYLAGNPHLNKRRQIISLHDINLYSEKLQEYLINTRYAKVLAIGYKYLSELQEVEFAERYVSSVAWNNQTSDELSYTGFED
ncbi:MAG: hypothetical protein ACPGTS_01635, partial [Minisyncoccia bacterium]